MNARFLSLMLLAAGAANAAFAQFGGLDFSKVSKTLDDLKDGAKVTKSVVGIGPEEERKLGEAVAIEIIGRFGGLVRDEDAMRRVNLIGRALARYSERPTLAWQFAILDSDTVNAFSAPGGLVFITRGLYAQAATDDELAGILAHEIAHITNKNALKIIQRGDAAGVLKGQLLKRSKDARKVDSDVGQVTEIGSKLGVDVVGGAKKIFEHGFDAPTEFTADHDGRAVATTTGFAPGGLRAVLIHLQEGETKKTIFSNHPPLADRLKKLPDDPIPTELTAVAASDAKDQPAGKAK